MISSAGWKIFNDTFYEKQGQSFVSMAVRLFAHTFTGFTHGAGIRCNPV